jgi:methionyl-tRNA formyltransferase
MGTPEFAVPSLEILLEHGFHILAVVTAPDRPAGRGLQLKESPVKRFAREQGLNILQPEKLKDPDFLQTLRALDADLNVVVAFRMLPELVWNMPPLGTINLHGSLLPQYRGAAPIQWAVLRGASRTGLTTFKLQHDIDTGSILFRQEVPIDAEETAGELHDRMMHIGARLLLKTVQAIQQGTYVLTSQATLFDPTQPLHPAPKIHKEDGEIHWDRPVEQIHNQVRGLSPYPGAYTFLEGKQLKILRSHKLYGPPLEKPGTWFSDHKHHLRWACQDGWLEVLELQLEGKKRMDTEAFLRGFRMPH